MVGPPMRWNTAGTTRARRSWWQPRSMRCSGWVCRLLPSAAQPSIVPQYLATPWPRCRITKVTKRQLLDVNSHNNLGGRRVMGHHRRSKRVARVNCRGDCLMLTRFRRVTGAVSAVAMLAISPNTAPASAAAIESPNLLVNSGAEFGDPSLSGYSSVSIPGWTVTGTPTVIKYGTLRRLPFPLGSPGPTLPAALGFPRAANGPPDGAVQFFGGGNVASATLSQTVELS